MKETLGLMQTSVFCRSVTLTAYYLWQPITWDGFRPPLPAAELGHLGLLATLDLYANA